MGRGLIVRDGETGEAVIAGTKVTVGDVLRELAGGQGVAAVLEAHPELTEEAVDAAVAFAAAAARREVRYGDLPRDSGTSVLREVAVAPYASELRARSGGAVVLQSDEYDDLLEQIEFLTALNQAQIEVAAGETVSEDEARAHFRSRWGG